MPSKTITVTVMVAVTCGVIIELGACGAIDISVEVVCERPSRVKSRAEQKARMAVSAL